MLFFNFIVKCIFLEQKAYILLQHVDVHKKIDILPSRGLIFLPKVDEAQKIFLLSQETNFLYDHTLIYV